jgi:hypothetical protein
MIEFLRRFLVPFALVVSITGGVRPAHAQGFPGGGMQPPAPSRAPKQQPKPSEPVTHAASGASDESMQFGGTEPSLPQNPH